MSKNAPKVTSTSSISPKVIASAIAAFLVPVIIGTLQYLLTPQGFTAFNGWPPALVVGLPALITGLITGLSGYVKNDPARVDGLTLPPKKTDGSQDASGNAAEKMKPINQEVDKSA